MSGVQTSSIPVVKDNTGLYVFGTIVIVLIFIAGLLIANRNKKPTNVIIPRKNNFKPDGSAAKVLAGKLSGIKSLKTGLWLSGSEYDYDGARRYCDEARGGLATVDQLKKAGEQGFEACTNGWLSRKNLGLYMQEDTPKCGSAGYNPQSVDNSTLKEKYSAYCYGPIPESNVTKYAIISK